MHYLGLALYAEGTTDYQFLTPLLPRLCDHLCATESLAPVDVGDVVALDHPSALHERPRDERIAAAAALHEGAWNIVFVHADGAGDPEKARAEAVQPALDALRARFPAAAPAIGVVPVRETEAWLLADGEALRSVFGVNLTDAQLRLPSPRHLVEALIDPKAVLQAAFMATGPTGQRRRKGTSPMLGALGDQVSLDCLAHLPSFRRLTEDLRAALLQMGVLTP